MGKKAERKKTAHRRCSLFFLSLFLPLSPVCPKMKLSGRKIAPKGPERTESMVPGSIVVYFARVFLFFVVEVRRERSRTKQGRRF